MINKRGQTLALFVILIPILLVIAAFVIDMGVVIYNKSHLKEVSKMALNENVDNLDNTNNIKKILEKNKVDINN